MRHIASLADRVGNLLLEVGRSYSAARTQTVLHTEAAGVDSPDCSFGRSLGCNLAVAAVDTGRLGRKPDGLAEGDTDCIGYMGRTCCLAE